MAEGSYRRCYREDLGFLAQSQETAFQDVSALLPEVLHRMFFGSGILSDEAVVSTVDRHLESASVYRDGKLIGIKNISDSEGRFLSPDLFTIRHSEKGDYQNGGYWPMFTLAELALAYRITGEAKYAEAIADLMETELGDGMGAKEFVMLTPGKEGTLFPRTFRWRQFMQFHRGSCKELSSLRSQLEWWNIGIMEYWVLGKWNIELMVKLLLTGKFIKLISE